MNDRPSARCVPPPSSDKPLQDYSPQELLESRAPTVDEHLSTIRQALALAVVVQTAESDWNARPLRDDARAALDRLYAEAWDLARQLSDGLPFQSLSLCVIKADEEQ